MKSKRTISTLCLMCCISVKTFAAGSGWIIPANAGDDNDETKSGNNSYVKQENTPGKISSNNESVVKNTPNVKSLFDTDADVTLCIQDTMGKSHTLRAIEVSKTGWTNETQRPDKMFDNITTRPSRQLCRTLSINGNATFTLLVDGTPSKMQVLQRWNDLADPSDVTYLWAAKLGGPLISDSSINTNGYISAILIRGQSVFKITGKNL